MPLLFLSPPREGAAPPGALRSFSLAACAAFWPAPFTGKGTREITAQSSLTNGSLLWPGLSLAFPRACSSACPAALSGGSLAARRCASPAKNPRRSRRDTPGATEPLPPLPGLKDKTIYNRATLRYPGHEPLSLPTFRQAWIGGFSRLPPPQAGLASAFTPRAAAGERLLFLYPFSQPA